MRPILLTLMLVLLLVAGCEKSEQPWSYAPCYVQQKTQDHHRYIEAWDCPVADGIHRWAWYPPVEIFPTEDGYYPLFTLQERPEES